MKYTCLLIGCICAVALIALPAQALTIDSLTISLDRSGNAEVNLMYQLSLPEQAAVFLHITDPSAKLEEALNENLNRQVTVHNADSSSADVFIPAFAGVGATGSGLTITTPSFSFAMAQEVMEHYWFGPLTSPDFSPGTTTIIFPDGYSASFDDQIRIPSVSCTLER
jgi:hypothetical protein